MERTWKHDWLPADFLRRMETMLGDAFAAFLASYDETRICGLRENPVKRRADVDTDFAAQMPFALSPVAWCPTGYYYEESERPGKHAYHEAGAYYIQEPSAMIVAELADPTPGEYVLDLCAAPGGKSTQLAGKLQGKGLLVANEIIPSRAKILSQNIERLGIANAVVLNHSPEELASVFPAFFDCIVVDAPCSGEGMFRKNHEACGEWSLEQVMVCAKRQEHILESAAEMLVPGGRLIYSTCTFSPEENEKQMEQFLERHPDYSLIEMHHLFPHKERGEGHFAAKLKKSGSFQRELPGVAGAAGSKKKGKKKAEKGNEKLDAYQSFLADVMADGKLPERFCGRLEWFGDNLYLVPEGMVDLKGLKTERPGLFLGTAKKGRFEPAHSFAMALRPGETRQSCSISADSGEMAGYLSGNSFPCEANQGWTLIDVDGFSIGWGKANNGIMKNHYPKGLYKTIEG